MTRNGTVLLIEDEFLVADVTTAMLTECGYSVVHAQNAEAAMPLLKSNKFTLILCDIGLRSSTDGLSFARSLRQSMPAMPILLMTGVEQRADEDPGEFNILIKPFGLETLRRVVSMVMQLDRAASGASG